VQGHDPDVEVESARPHREDAVDVAQEDGDGTIWVGGGTVTCVTGEVEL